MLLADFVNYASTNKNITDANWHKFGKQVVSKLGRQLIDIVPHPDRVQRYSNSGRHNLFMR